MHISPCDADEHRFGEAERADCETIVAAAVANKLAPSVAALKEAPTEVGKAYQ